MGNELIFLIDNKLEINSFNFVDNSSANFFEQVPIQIKEISILDFKSTWKKTKYQACWIWFQEVDF